jgi:hypothetical protein
MVASTSRVLIGRQASELPHQVGNASSTGGSSPSTGIIATPRRRDATTRWFATVSTVADRKGHCEPRAHGPAWPQRPASRAARGRRRDGGPRALRDEHEERAPAGVRGLPTDQVRWMALAERRADARPRGAWIRKAPQRPRRRTGPQTTRRRFAGPAVGQGGAATAGRARRIRDGRRVQHAGCTGRCIGRTGPQDARGRRKRGRLPPPEAKRRGADSDPTQDEVRKVPSAARISQTANHDKRTIGRARFQGVVSSRTRLGRRSPRGVRAGGSPAGLRLPRANVGDARATLQRRAAGATLSCARPRSDRTKAKCPGGATSWAVRE